MACGVNVTLMVQDAPEGREPEQLVVRANSSDPGAESLEATMDVISRDAVPLLVSAIV